MRKARMLKQQNKVGLKINSVSLVFGFGIGEYPEYYKKGIGKDLKDAIKSMTVNKFNYIQEPEKMAIIEFLENCKKD